LETSKRKEFMANAIGSKSILTSKPNPTLAATPAKRPYKKKGRAPLGTLPDSKAVIPKNPLNRAYTHFM